MMVGAVAGAAAEEKTEFDAILAEAGSSKVGVIIKQVRENHWTWLKKKLKT